jgi:hypothetical protein
MLSVSGLWIEQVRYSLDDEGIRINQRSAGKNPMITSIDQTAINLGFATLLGATIGFERQWRQRMAGLRTNTLVAIGAASFVIFADLFPGEPNPTRVAAQVVSGIGFLGAGSRSPGSTPRPLSGVQRRLDCSPAQAIRCTLPWPRALSA